MLDRLGRVLVHPLRRRLLLEYQRENPSPSQVASRLGLSVGIVSYHTSVLARHGYVELVGTARRRGALQHFYRSTVDTVIEDEEWESVPSQLRRALVLGTLAQVTEEARQAALDGGFDRAVAHLTRSPLQLDEQGVAAAARCLRDALDQIGRIETACRERAGPVQRQYEVVILGFEGQPGGSAPAAPEGSLGS
jgi:DNA-binding transcriptional ArsR family regulator